MTDATVSDYGRYIARAFLFAFFGVSLFYIWPSTTRDQGKHSKKIEIILHNFVNEAENLYDSHHITYNLHLLTHLCKNVIDWGCLWSTSTFIPEWINGDLQSLFNGTQNVVDQMAQMYLTRIAIRNEAIEVLRSKHVPKDVSCLLEKLLCLPKLAMSDRSVRNYRVLYGCTLRGKATKRNLVNEEIVALKNLFRLNNCMSESDRIELEYHQDYAMYAKFKLGTGGFTQFVLIVDPQSGLIFFVCCKTKNSLK